MNITTKNYDKRITVALTQEQFDFVLRNSLTKGYTISEYIRTLLANMPAFKQFIEERLSDSPIGK